MKAMTQRDCAFLERGPDAECYSADMVLIGRSPNWWCTWGETVDPATMPPWVHGWVQASINFDPDKYCNNCPVYQPLEPGSAIAVTSAPTGREE